MVQSPDTQWVMVKKKKVGFLVPEPLIDLLDEFAEGFGGKGKWIAISSALLHFAELTPEQRGLYAGWVSGAMHNKGFAPLITLAKQGELRKDLKVKSAMR